MSEVAIITDPSITIDDIEFVCHGSHVALVPTDMQADISTWCAPGAERPGSTTWDFSIELKQSYGTGSTWTQLRAIAKTLQTVVVKPNVAAVSATNPSATFSIYVPSIPFVDAGIGEATSFTLACKVVGQPVFAVA